MPDRDLHTVEYIWIPNMPGFIISSAGASTLRKYDTIVVRIVLCTFSLQKLAAMAI